MTEETLMDKQTPEAGVFAQMFLTGSIRKPDSKRLK